MGSRLHGSDGVSHVILRIPATKNPKHRSAAAIWNPKSIAQRDVGAVREPPLRRPTVMRVEPAPYSDTGAGSERAKTRCFRSP